jgi:peptidoglycan-associated lipoprotein
MARLQENAMSFNPRPAVRLMLAGCAALALVACASKPKPAPTPAPPPPPIANNGQEATPAAPPAPVSSAPLPGSEQDFVVNVGDRVYFDFDQYQIRPDAQPVLAAQAAWLSRYPAVQVRIEGNCDERGTREYNLALGARRANSVKDFLVSHGVDPGRITTISYGKERPIDPDSNEQAWAKNRNAHTAIVSGAR